MSIFRNFFFCSAAGLVSLSFSRSVADDLITFAAMGDVPCLPINILTDPLNKMKQGHDRKSLLGLGIDEGTAIVIQNDQLEVIGKPHGAVLIYDPSTWDATLPDKGKFIRLGPGSKYNLNKRVVLKNIPPAPTPPKKKKP